MEIALRLPMHVAMSFDAKNPLHRKQLFPVLRALADLSVDKSPLEFLNDATSGPVTRGTDYLSNVRKGNFAESIAKQLYLWLEENHFELAHKISAEIFPIPPAVQWGRIVKANASRGQLAVVTHQSGFGALARASKAQRAEASIKLNEYFHFEMEVAAAGYLTLFQHVGSEWAPLELNGDDDLFLALSVGLNRFPVLTGGQIDPICEQRDLGPQEFVAVVSKVNDVPLTPRQLLNWYPQSGSTLYSLTIDFTK
ncbi:hypothetical protein [Phaeobacter inhibens]|uniref:hypothetical protein n=1 Tax=Phaeobacter inhibens TaxID=221822 RepID=UPI0021A8FBAC|nr:hypothetical protein [Phaeobacter inhibens]UWR57093.1 hypothetical protein K4F89_01140 [Phaeobacter inhibens]